jgi:hypothetical protein
VGRGVGWGSEQHGWRGRLCHRRAQRGQGGARRVDPFPTAGGHVPHARGTAYLIPKWRFQVHAGARKVRIYTQQDPP